MTECTCVGITDMGCPVHRSSDPEERERLLAVIDLLCGLLPPEQEPLLRKIVATVRPIIVPRAGNVLGAISSLLPQRPEWTTGEIKQEIKSLGMEASAKEIYNALGYLVRKGYVKQLRQVEPTGAWIELSGPLLSLGRF